MLAGMSAFSSLIGPTQADCWPMAQVMAGLSAVPVGHAIDLAFFFPMTDGNGMTRWWRRPGGIWADA